MKLAVTSQGPDLRSSIDPRFGRAKCFIVIDTQTGQFSAADNSINLNAAQGAGIQAAETVSRLGAEVVITGHCGPKAFRAIAVAGIEVYAGVEEHTVAEAIALYEAGRIEPLETADTQGHW